MEGKCRTVGQNYKSLEILACRLDDIQHTDSVLITGTWMHFPPHSESPCQVHFLWMSKELKPTGILFHKVQKWGNSCESQILQLREAEGPHTAHWMGAEIPVNSSWGSRILSDTLQYSFLEASFEYYTERSVNWQQCKVVLSLVIQSAKWLCKYSKQHSCTTSASQVSYYGSAPVSLQSHSLWALADLVYAGAALRWICMFQPFVSIL